MASKLHTHLAGLLALTSLAACTGTTAPPPALPAASGEAAAEVATFEGRYDPATGDLTIRTTPVADASGRVGRSVYQPLQDGSPGTGPDNTFELVTEASPAPGFSVVGCGGAGSFDGRITLRSFFKAQAFSSVYLELTSVSGDHNACNSAAPVDGMSATFGLWNYGPIAVGGSNSKDWSFRFATSEAFVFRGRILAQVAPLVAPANGPTTFEWAPTMFADPPHSFQDTGTTLSHLVWNGTGFTDTKNAASLALVGAAVPSTTVGIAYPAQAHVGPRADLTPWRYEATPATLGQDTSGDFTVCVKFKPGVNPGPLERKVLVALGNPIGQVNGSYGPADFGWALTQQHGAAPSGTPQYGFFYRTGNDPSATDTFGNPGPNPEQSAFDYTCGGRVSTGCVITNEPLYTGPCIRVLPHGRDVRFDYKVTGSFTDHVNPATLPLVIGSAATGLWPAFDAGVYEVIIDSRGATNEVMRSIVDAAEGRRLYNGATYLGNDVDAKPMAGVDLLTYGFPLGSTAPVTSDATGLMTAGTLLRFASLLTSSAGAYCVGAEVTSPDWANAVGGIVGDDNGILRLFIPPGDHVLTGFNGSWPAWGPDLRIVNGGGPWPANSRHAFKVCATTGADVVLYVDGVEAARRAPAATLLDVTSPANQVHVGQGFIDAFGAGLVPLTGARIGRVFACPTAVASSCN